MLLNIPMPKCFTTASGGPLTLAKVKSNLITVTLGLIVLLQGFGASAAANTWVCNNKDTPGGWGALSLGCDADQYGDLKRMKSIYAPLIFDRRPDGIETTDEYITNVTATIKEIAREYYLKRVPDAKPATLAAWIKTAVAVAAHESMLSHYRIGKDNRFKFMTGDHLVSHGIMQVNQLYHANKNFDSSFDLVGNVVAGLDYYFTQWDAAIKQDCWKSSLGKAPTLALMLENRARSAYSSYNSGSDFCRFTNPKAKWANNDNLFFESLHNEPWKKHVTDDNRKSPVNVKCLMDGDELCAVAQPARQNFVKDRPIILADGRTCITTDGAEYSCAEDDRVFSCLAQVDPEVLDNDPVKMAKLPEGAKVTVVKDRDALCLKSVKSLIGVGQSILLKREILLRDEVGGSPLGNTKVGRIFQVLDYEIRLGGKTERYYRIKTPNGTDGWIYGGDDNDNASWVTVATDQDKADLVRADEQAKIEKAARRAAEEAAARDAAAAKAAAAAAAATPEPTPEDIIITGRREPKPVATPVPVAPAPAKPALSSTNEGDQAVVPGAAAKDDDDDEPTAVLPVQGSIIEIVHPGGIPLRKAAGEDQDNNPIDQTEKGARFTVEEVAVKGSDNMLFLKVSMGEKVGWIYAGRTALDSTVAMWIKVLK